MAKGKTKPVAPTKTSATSSSTALAPAPSPEGSLSRYLAEIRKFPILEAQEEYELARDYAEKGNVKAAHTLVTSHLRLVAKIAMGYRGYGLPIGEVISEGNVGLMQAVKKFDAERGFRLATYAMWWIRASIQEYILRSWSLVKIGTTAAQKKLFFNLRRLKGEINAIDGGAMTPEQVAEIADRLGVQENEVEIMDGRMSTGDQSLNTPMRGRGAEGEDGGEWQDWLEDSAESQEAVLAEEDELDARRQLLMTALATLNEREADILHARRLRDEPETLEQLSEKFGVSRERIRQIEARAFEKLRTAMTEQAEKRGLIEG